MPSRGTYVLPNGTHSAAMPNFAFELGNLSVGQHELIIQHRIDAACSFEQLQPKDVLKLARICALSERKYTAGRVKVDANLNGRSQSPGRCQCAHSDMPRGFEDSLQSWCAQYATCATDTIVQESACNIHNLARWSKEKGVQSNTQPAVFHGGIRGLAAASSVPIGETAVSVPEALLISHTTAQQSDLGQVLAQFPQLSADSIAVIWTMAERHDADSARKPFWDSLPQTLHSGLSMPDSLVDILHGTPAQAECQSAREHITAQFQELQPILAALVTAYPQHLQASWFSWKAYLWAVQLWYAYAIRVQWPDSSCKDCLVPYASLMNHSIHPHIVRYSRLDSELHQLQFRLFRPLAEGQQCFLSYGPLSNLKLLLFYGMAIDQNPYDAVAIDLRAGAKPWHLALLSKFGLPLEHQLHRGQLPQTLLMAASLIGLAPTALKGLTKHQLQHRLMTASYQAAQQSVLLPAVEHLQPKLQHCLEQCQQTEEKDYVMLHCLTLYLQGQLAVLETVMSQLESLPKCCDAIN